MIKRSLAIATVCALSMATTHAAQTECSQCEAWNQDQTPFQIFGNTYFVGTHGLSSVLITSPQGHILIDGALPQSAPLIARHIERLGFKVADIKLLLNSHVHFDHAGGIAELQQASGAKVIASDIAAQVLTAGKSAANDPQAKHLPAFPAIKNVEPLGDKRTLSIGPLTLTVMHTPGHTPGGTSWTWRSCEGERCLNMVYGDSLNAVSDEGFKYSGDARYPNARTDMEGSIATFEKAPCDILIAAHPDFTGLWNIIDAQGKGDRARLIDAQSCKRYAAGGKERFAQRLQSEKPR